MIVNQISSKLLDEALNSAMFTTLLEAWVIQESCRSEIQRRVATQFAGDTGP